MKTEKFYELLSDIDQRYVQEAETTKRGVTTWRRWASAAACLVLVLLAALSIPRLVGDLDVLLPPNGESDTTTQAIDTELLLEKEYVYRVEHTVFSNYVQGKVISEDQIDDKFADVSVIAGWRFRNKESWGEMERLRGELYTIRSIAQETAVALKFIDKGDALTTTHYYVIMNPEADLTAVKDYIITANEQKDQGNKILPE